MRIVRTISRDTIIEALKTENLGHRGWVGRSSLPYIGDCEVCAVGGIFRHLGLPNSKIASGAFDNAHDPIASNVEIPLAKGDYLGALSSLFESERVRRMTQKSARRVLVNFVKKNFPSRIRLADPLHIPSQADLDAARADWESLRR